MGFSGGGSNVLLPHTHDGRVAQDGGPLNFANITQSQSASGEISVLVERCLLEMQESDFQSDERFTRRFVESKLTNKPQGPFKILQDLQNRGISNELAQTVLNELSDQDIWLKKAVECLARIQKNAKIQTQAALSQKLYQRGFAWETIEQALEEYQNLEEPADT